MDYRRILAAIRERLGLTRTELAARIGVATITIERWEKGSSKPHPVFERKIAELTKEAGMIG